MTQTQRHEVHPRVLQRGGDEHRGGARENRQRVQRQVREVKSRGSRQQQRHRRQRQRAKHPTLHPGQSVHVPDDVLVDILGPRVLLGQRFPRRRHEQVEPSRGGDLRRDQQRRVHVQRREVRREEGGDVRGERRLQAETPDPPAPRHDANDPAHERAASRRSHRRRQRFHRRRCELRESGGQRDVEFDAERRSVHDPLRVGADDASAQNTRGRRGRPIGGNMIRPISTHVRTSHREPNHRVDVGEQKLGDAIAERDVRGDQNRAPHDRRDRPPRRRLVFVPHVVTGARAPDVLLLLFVITFLRTTRARNRPGARADHREDGEDFARVAPTHAPPPEDPPRVRVVLGVQHAGDDLGVEDARHARRGVPHRTRRPSDEVRR
mmetsp:Transcript_5832/g.26959  ORF Transcript_5832/g.26959 Transcript_5832/m.26959 type:complete len:379 (+) Transcript_5832:342-1478(+)